MLNREHLDRTHAFFEKYGGKAVVLGRFVPIVRTFVPFVAGGGAMTYGKFAFFNVSGAILWIGICFGAGLLFGNVPIVKDNFSLVAIGIVLVSVIPIGIELLKKRRTAVVVSDRSEGRRAGSLQPSSRPALLRSACLRCRAEALPHMKVTCASEPRGRDRDVRASPGAAEASPHVFRRPVFLLRLQAPRQAEEGPAVLGVAAQVLTVDGLRFRGAPGRQQHRAK